MIEYLQTRAGMTKLQIPSARRPVNQASITGMDNLVSSGIYLQGQFKPRD